MMIPSIDFLKFTFFMLKSNHSVWHVTHFKYIFKDCFSSKTRVFQEFKSNTFYFSLALRLSTI